MDDVIRLLDEVGIGDNPIVVAIVVIVAGIIFFGITGAKRREESKDYVDDVKRIIKKQRSAEKDTKSSKESVDEWAKNVRGK